MADVLTRGFVWQLGTYMFLHDGFWHLFLNMFPLWIFGSHLERIWGRSFDESPPPPSWPACLPACLPGAKGRGH